MNSPLAGGFDSLILYEDWLCQHRLEGPFDYWGGNGYQYRHDGYIAYVAECGHVTMAAKAVARPRTCGLVPCMVECGETADGQPDAPQGDVAPNLDLLGDGLDMA